MMGIFDWKKKEANYEKIKIEKKKVLKEWRREMKWWRKENREEEISIEYAILKEKDVEKMRLIILYVKHP
jgi:hypothetical protein